MRSRSGRIIGIALINLSIVCLLLYLYDNTDRSIRTLRTNGAVAMMFSDSSEGLYQEMLKEDELYNKEIEALITAKGGLNSCLKSPALFRTPKDQLESFVRGDCAPVIVLPGLMGTKLVAEIDCEVLQTKNPEVMKACGWNTCDPKQIFAKRPDSEYLIWVPTLDSPMSILRVTDNHCFGTMFGFTYNNETKSPFERYKKIEGITITWFGNSSRTQSSAGGGFPAVSNIMPLPIQVEGSQAYAGIDKLFTQMGYQKGLSLFAIPYDFRLTQVAGSVQYTLERTIRYAYELTGKKVVIVAHSLGNINTLPVLMKMDQADKDKMIAAYVAAAPPYGGASKTIRLMMGGDQGMMYKNLVGMKYFNQKSFLNAAASIFDLVPSDAFYRFRYESWMRELLQRIELENRYDINTEEGAKFWKNVDKSSLPLSFFPNPSEVCFKGFTQRPAECRTLITDLASQYIANIKGEKYYANIESLETLLKKYYFMGSLTNALEAYKEARNNGNLNFGNPGVPVVYIFESHLETELYSEWDYDPSKLTFDGEFAFPSRTSKLHGDGTVEISYSLPIALKWAWEHQNKVQRAKPIKVVEFCSTYNAKTTVWDSVNSMTGTRVMDKTEYMGSLCACSAKLPSDASDCEHAGMISDPNFLNLVADTALTKEVVDLQTTAAYKLSQERLSELIYQLPHLRKSRSDQDVKQWLYNHSKVIIE